MKITYLNHSGFLLEWPECYWIFDYYKGEIPVLDAGKDIIVFCSHSHHDHFNPEIFQLLKDYPKVSYVFADEMREACKKINADEIHYLEDHTDVTIKGLKIHTLKSTDMGCAFVIEYDGQTIYHAGDLHWWYWEGEDPDWNAQITADYKKEIEYLKGKTLALAFTPLDPRQGNEYALGMNYLLNTAEVKHVFPMHCWDDISIIDKYLQEYELPKTTKLYHLKEVSYEI
jgi:L-ascorbate metabolism protein UlaG (beta-lactamase superfamily)